MGIEFLTLDGLVNWLSGLGVPGRDKNASSAYTFNMLSRAELEAMYRSDWLAQKIVNLPAQDSTRQWRSWQADNTEIEALENAEKKFCIQQKVKNGLIYRRLYGGSCLLMGVDQGRPDEELDIEGIQKGDLKFVHVLGRWSLGVGPIVSDVLSKYYGEPEYYTIAQTPKTTMKDLPSGSQGYVAGSRIHPSRVVRFSEGIPMEVMQQTIADGWGDSALQTVVDAVKATTSVLQTTATMMQDSKVDVFSLPDLSKNISRAEYRQRLTDRFSFANVSKSVINAIVKDKEEDWERISSDFGAFPELLRVFLLVASGAADIPATRLLSQSPTGMSATGESDIRNYYDRLADDQANELQPALERLDRVFVRSVLGEHDESLHYIWNPLWQLSATEKATIAKTKADTFKIDNDVGLIDPEALRIARQNQLIEDGVYPGLEQALEQQMLLSEESMLTPQEQLQVLQEKAEAEAEEAAAAAGAATPAPAPAKDSEVKDAAPRTLYVRRDVINAGSIRAWAKKQGFKSTLDDLHVTIAFSREAVDWMKCGSGYSGDSKGHIEIVPGGPRIIERFMPSGAVVLLFNSSELIWRHKDICNAGASWDHEDYQPHITLTYDPGDVDIENVEPYRGSIVLGPEIFEEVDLEWKNSVREASLDGVVPFDDEFGFKEVTDLFEESKHKRAAKGTKEGGQFSSTGSGTPVDTKATLRAASASKVPVAERDPLVDAHEDKKRWPEHIQKLRVPPAWTSVKYSMDPTADLLVVGKDAKGRSQYVYSESFTQTQAAAKFSRVQELSKKFREIEAQNWKRVSLNEPRVKEHAECVALIMSMGLRPGSTVDTKSDVKAYGASTLEGRHVIEKDGDLYLEFTGKKGVGLSLKVEDKRIDKMLRRRAKEAGLDGTLFKGVTQESLSEYSQSLDGGGFKTKDFRTTLGTTTASELVQEMPSPKSPGEYKRAVREVAQKVAEKLGNTPTVALQSYIDPTVFGGWRAAVGV